MKRRSGDADVPAQVVEIMLASRRARGLMSKGPRCLQAAAPDCIAIVVLEVCLQAARRRARQRRDFIEMICFAKEREQKDVAPIRDHGGKIVKPLKCCITQKGNISSLSPLRFIWCSSLTLSPSTIVLAKEA